MPDRRPGWTARLRRMRRQVQVWSKRHLPPGLRLVAGLLLMLGGVFGFLPVIGFWMFPLGVAVAALDLVPIVRWIRGRQDNPPKDKR
ncbi:hypothetical protein HAT86_02540 [Roseovarius gahaiensis]|uniref:Transmembrane protein (PGPGW) n=1 Tax=Roseovarius gahaiensis TaxID=2716691 RepID=A0A967BAS3_9RHOB|nr:hypothetical protein [Roseovarius gahaiensis]NHQ73343.1 hypothetical protein [Roseovarius gahaiensis]